MKAVEKVVEFFTKEPGARIETITSLTGGVHNPVLLVQVTDASDHRKAYVVKGFVDEASAQRTRTAQAVIDRLDFHGMKMIPSGRLAVG